MLSKKQKEQIVEQLDTQANVQDVYFSKDILFIVNAYDVSEVSNWLDGQELNVEFRYVDEFEQFEF